MNVSIIICTRNRAESLKKTLEALKGVEVRKELKVELLVVDNGSTDHTQEVVESALFPRMVRRYLVEKSPGVVKARNTGLAAAQGEIILSIDDDVAPDKMWLEYLCQPLLDRSCDGVVGKIELDPNVARTWMASLHRLWLAAPVEVCQGVPDLIGANMGFRRSVLNHVPAFDSRLGPGALGFDEDSLFSWQMREAGLRIQFVPRAVVTHSPSAARLLRSSWLDAARCRGRAEAYLLHHWKHEEIKWPGLRACYLAAKLFLRRVVQPPPPMTGEGAPPWEISYEYQLETCRQYLMERRLQRVYDKRGLRKMPASQQN